MNTHILPISIKSIIPTTNGSAVFLNQNKMLFVLYVDKEIGELMEKALHDVPSERPMTHDLMLNILDGLEAEIERVIINDVQNGTYYARLILSMENELGHKIIELDARPSDSITLALLSKKPIYVTQEVLDKVEDMTEIFNKINHPKT